MQPCTAVKLNLGLNEAKWPLPELEIGFGLETTSWMWWSASASSRVKCRGVCRLEDSRLDRASTSSRWAWKPCSLNLQRACSCPRSSLRCLASLKASSSSSCRLEACHNADSTSWIPNYPAHIWPSKAMLLRGGRYMICSLTWKLHISKYYMVVQSTIIKSDLGYLIILTPRMVFR